MDEPNADYVTLDPRSGGGVVLSHRPAVRLPDGTDLPVGRAVHLLVSDGDGDVAAIILEPAEAVRLATGLLALSQRESDGIPEDGTDG